MNAVDSSVVIAAFSSWHEQHEVARRAIAKRPHLPEHAAIEAYSVLTTLPAPYRADPKLVHRYLSVMFEGRLIGHADDPIGAVGTLADLAISGGASYDGWIGLAAKQGRATLLTLDRRARATYDRLGVRVRVLEG